MTVQRAMKNAGGTTFDFVARILFFAAAPFVLVFVTQAYPVLGAIVNVATALVVVLAAEAIRTWSTSSKIVAFLFRRQLEFDDFYRKNPPRPFLYYALYPALFPYWLFNAKARREFLLFKGYTLFSLLVLIVSVIVQYVRYWPPQLTVVQYLPTVAITFALEALVVAALLMPIATTVIALHLSQHRGRLVTLMCIAALSTTAAIIVLMQRRDPVVSYATRRRVQLRSLADKRHAHDAELAAVKAAWPLVQKHAADLVEGDGKVEGEALERAHKVLEKFYREDEAFSFDLWASPRKHPRLLVLYFEAYRGKAPIWVAIDAKQAEVKSGKALPKGAFSAMKSASDTDLLDLETIE